MGGICRTQSKILNLYKNLVAKLEGWDKTGDLCDYDRIILS
jgi:hypothetical protein